MKKVLCFVSSCPFDAVMIADSVVTRARCWLSQKLTTLLTAAERSPKSDTDSP
ncbi:MAG: hypothetical protein KME49_20560 [Brasilonema octagenarum HA4186-MV1]|jgi:hypothetical protein|nr:hypothetical protein [Brasilonema octagenarum HA4186-MV1]